MIDTSVERDLKSAVDLFDEGAFEMALVKFRKLSDQGCFLADAYLGYIYEVGNRAVPRNYRAALSHYQISAEKTGSLLAFFGLIRIYFYGLGVERDCVKAMGYCETVCKSTESPYAYFYMGKICLDESWSGYDLERAKRCFDKAWNLGYIPGLGYLGLAEQRSGRNILGILMRVKALLLAVIVTVKNSNDPRIRRI
ncbi:tetratricopeptide repeat protein [Marinobacter sp. C2H3]|uniref:tetratricopeptide repeat protein n=1 Tax=Marinobacter sp. C2H3 TaxID=3119003 RepID=UPI00300EAEE3